MRCGKGIGMWERFGKCERKKENSSDTPDQCKGADGGGAVKTPEAARTSEKWIDCARNGVSG